MTPRTPTKQYFAFQFTVSWWIFNTDIKFRNYRLKYLQCGFKLVFILE